MERLLQVVNTFATVTQGSGLHIYAIIATVLLLISLVGFIYYCVKGGNLIIGLFITATFWFLLGVTYSLWSASVNSQIESFKDAWNIFAGNLNLVFSDGPINYGTTTTVIIFASWFGRVIVDTGIAKALIKKVVELSGDMQLVTVIVLSIVTALLFTSIFGPGSVMAIGAIILPILLTIGVNKKVAVGSFLMAVAAGMYVNKGFSIQFSTNPFFEQIWSIPGFASDFTVFTWLAFLVHVVFMIGFIVFNMYFAKDKIKSWAMADDGMEKEVKGISFIVPFIPAIISLTIAIINMFLPANVQPTATSPGVINQITDVAAITSFVIGIILGLALTGNLKTYKKAIETSQKTLFNGISDVALLIGMLLVLNMFSTAASKLAAPIFQTALGDSLNGLANNPIWIVVAFAILAPLALFRGPFMVWGSGIALVTVMSTFIPATTPLLLVLFYVQPVAIVAQSCPTQSWGMWALSYAKYEPNTFIKTNIPWAWAICAINIFLAYFILM